MTFSPGGSSHMTACVEFVEQHRSRQLQVHMEQTIANRITVNNRIREDVIIS